MAYKIIVLWQKEAVIKLSNALVLCIKLIFALIFRLTYAVGAFRAYSVRWFKNVQKQFGSCQLNVCEWQSLVTVGRERRPVVFDEVSHA